MLAGAALPLHEANSRAGARRAGAQRLLRKTERSFDIALAARHELDPDGAWFQLHLVAAFGCEMHRLRQRVTGPFPLDRPPVAEQHRAARAEDVDDLGRGFPRTSTIFFE